VNKKNTCTPSNPLVVDLDGTLLKTDLLFESASRFILTYPFRIFRLLIWLLKGKAILKSKLANYYQIDPACLPYNSDLVSWLSAQKNEGRTIVLATASHRDLAQKIADHLNIFDEVIATDDEVNIKSKIKRDELVMKYGEKGFDYVGNSKCDLPVWRSANNSYIVNASKSLLRKADFVSGCSCIPKSRNASVIKNIINEVRPHQWSKNVLVFIPLLTSHLYLDEQSAVNALMGFVAFCFVASSVYVFNDIIDISSDRIHKSKKYRPLASGNLSLLHAWFTWPSLSIIGVFIASCTLSFEFVVVLVSYFLITMFYSVWIKKVYLADVLVLAFLYTIRIFAGAVAISIEVSTWLLTFSIFFFLSLAFIKRLSEIKAMINNRRSGASLPGRGYLTDDFGMVLSMGTGAGYISVLVLALYINDKYVSDMYSHPKLLWIACPLLLFWVLRAWSIAYRGGMHEDPIVFSIKDKFSWVIGTGFTAAFVFARSF
jgi:4-hydroxybenzoate polyprenyltransferase/phosphoserine phosphatase